MTRDEAFRVYLIALKLHATTERAMNKAIEKHMNVSTALEKAKADYEGIK
jgi:hypothetical protein